LRSEEDQSLKDKFHLWLDYKLVVKPLVQHELSLKRPGYRLLSYSRFKELDNQEVIEMLCRRMRAKDHEEYKDNIKYIVKRIRPSLGDYKDFDILRYADAMHTPVNTYIDQFVDYDRFQRWGATERELATLPKPVYGTVNEPGVIRYFLKRMGTWATHFERKIGEQELKKFKNFEDFIQRVRDLNDEIKDMSRTQHEFALSFKPIAKLEDNPDIDKVYDRMKHDRARVSLHAILPTAKPKPAYNEDSETEDEFPNKSNLPRPDNSDSSEDEVDDVQNPISQSITSAEQDEFLNQLADAHLSVMATYNAKPDQGKGPIRAADASKLRSLPCFAEFEKRGGCKNGDKCPYSHDPAILKAHGERMRSKRATPPMGQR
jgi:hypothetical protein